MSILALDPERFSLFSRRPRKIPNILRRIEPAPLPDENLEKAAQVKVASIRAKSIEISRMAIEMKELADSFLANFERSR